MEPRPVRVSASPTKATTLSCSTIFWIAARCRAGSPPSSAKMAVTGWPLIPPWALAHLTQTRTASRMGSKGAPSTPEATPTLPILTAAGGAPLGAGAGPPGAGAGTPGVAAPPAAGLPAPDAEPEPAVFDSVGALVAPAAEEPAPEPEPEPDPDPVAEA